MSKKRKALSQEEIWDDTELIDSWNEALAEYKHYHSLHARGEKVEQVLRQAEEDDTKPASNAMGTDAQSHEDDADGAYTDAMDGSDGEISESKFGAAHNQGTGKADQPAAFADSAPPLQATPVVAVPAGGSSAAVLQALLGGTQDAALKNLMMSWYYAGYYTGYYEGQQAQAQVHVQVQAQAQNGQKAEPRQNGNTGVGG